MNWKLVIAYDGGHFLGWQKTKEGPSVEETLQNILEQILQHPVALQAASRTDAGVHAQAQVVNFMTTKARITPLKLCISLNSLLPNAIAVLEAQEMPDEFHPTLDCKEKEYHYWICHGTAQMPQHRFFSWHYPHALDVDSMKQAAEALIGAHDFKAFCNELKNAHYDSTRREIKSIVICRHPADRLQVMIRGNNFLYKMVRNIVGTLLYVGRGKIKTDDIPLILKSRERALAGVTAPAHGLTLFNVLY